MAGVPATFFTDKADIQLEFSLQWSFPDYQTWLEKGDDNFKGIPINNQSAGCWQLEIPIKETREGDKLGRHIKLTMLMKDDSNGYLARMSILNPAQEPRLQREILGFSCNSTLGIFFFSSRALKALVNVTGGLTIKVEIAKLKTKTNPKPGAIQVISA